LQSGAADAWLDDRNLLHTFMLDHCGTVAEVSDIDILRSFSSVLLVLRKEDEGLAANMSEVRANTREPLLLCRCLRCT
jgi:hypothetical protein